MLSTPTNPSPDPGPVRFSALPSILALAFILLLLGAGSMSVNAQSIPERADVPDEYKWDLSSFYADTDSWEADFARVDELLPEVTAFRGRLGEGGGVLLAALEASQEAERVVGNLMVYAGLKSFEDLRNTDNSARYSRASALYSRFGEETAFFSPELLEIPEAELAAMVDATPGLQAYRHFLDEASRMRPYTLSEAEERLLAMASDPLGKPQSVFTQFDNSDLVLGTILDEEGETIEVTKASYYSLMKSPDRRVREEAWRTVYGAYEKMGNTLAANYEGHVKGRVFLARARGFDSALEAAVYTNGIPESVYRNLISATRERGAAPLQRLLKLRRDELELDDLRPWDSSAPMLEPTIKDIPFEQAKEIVADALAPLGEEYLALYWKGFDEGWVDAFESVGKRGGAYSWGTVDAKPYLSMNYQGTLDSVSTLAHEYGHSLHSWLSWETQPVQYAYYRTFIAEIASMTNEALMFQKMLAEATTPRERAYLLQTYLDEFRGGFYTQVAFADYEMQAHAMVEEGGALNKDSLNKIYADTFAAYQGDAVLSDPLAASGWSRIPHFLRTDNFYVYQYATSIVAATALAKGILEDGEPARERFLTMLKSGSSDYPIELLKAAGVDMTTPQPVYDTLALIDELVGELETVLAELQELE